MININEEYEQDMEERNTVETGDDFGFVVTSGDASSLNSEKDWHVVRMLPSKPTTPADLLVYDLLLQIYNFMLMDLVDSRQLYRNVRPRPQEGKFETKRSHFQRSISHIVSEARGQSLSNCLQTIWSMTFLFKKDWLQYHLDFEEIAFISGGGFGRVYRVKKRECNFEYAMKEVIIKSTNLDNMLLDVKEVFIHTKLKHINIVAFKKAWIEPLVFCETDDTPNDTDTPSVSVEDTGSDSVIFAASSSNNGTNSSQEDQSDGKKYWAMLYIEMSLCQLTLRNFLDHRNSSDDFSQFFRKFLCDFCYQSEIPCLPVSMNVIEREDPQEHLIQVALVIFYQLATAVEYIHKCGIVHHDIKPSNVFITVSKCKRLLVQLGDFGLACCREWSHRSSGVMGTLPYAAPEQLIGQCDPKSDIHSLGMILLELLSPFSTCNERCRVIDDAKSGRFPSTVPTQLATLIDEMINRKPSDRHTSRKLCKIIKLIAYAKDEVASAKQLHEMSEEDKSTLDRRCEVIHTRFFRKMKWKKTKNSGVKLEHKWAYEEEKRVRREWLYSESHNGDGDE